MEGGRGSKLAMFLCAHVWLSRSDTLHKNTVTPGKSLPPLCNGFGHISKVTYSLTVGDAARLFALMNVSGNFTMLNYSKKFSTI